MTETAKQTRRSFTDKIFGSSASKARRQSLPAIPSTKPRRSSKTKNSLRNSTNSQPARRPSGEIDNASNPHDIIAMLEQMATHDGASALQAFQHLAHPDQSFSDEEEEDRRDLAAAAAAHEEVSEEFSVASTASGSGKKRRGSKNRNSIRAVIDVALAEDALEEIMEDFE